MPEMPKQKDFFEQLEPVDEIFIKEQREVEERTRLAEKETEKKYRKKSRPHQIQPPSAVKSGGWEKDYYGNDPNNSNQ